MLDAIGRGIQDLAHSLATLPEEGRPSQVVMAIVTDGAENSSREFTRTQITEMIQEKQKQQDRQFVFLSADLNALDDAEAQGVRASHAMAYDQTAGGTRAAWGALTARTSDYRAHRQETCHSPAMTASNSRVSSCVPAGLNSGVETPKGEWPAKTPGNAHNARYSKAKLGADLDSQPADLPGPSTWDRVEGMLLGLAIGDSLGNTSEAQTPQTRRAKYGEIRDYRPNRHADDRPVGAPSDDTQMAFWLLEQMLEDGKFDPDRLAQKIPLAPSMALEAVLETLSAITRIRASSGNKPGWRARATALSCVLHRSSCPICVNRRQG